MKRFLPLFALLLIAAAPSRVVDYVPNTEIEDAAVESNEDAIFTYLQNGVDTIANGAVETADIQDGAITSAKIANGTITQNDLAFTINQGNSLPSGAVFFMLSGNCPSWTTDVSTTYSNQFLRVNASPLQTGGDTSHTHGVGSYTTTSSGHTHTVPRDGWGATDVGTSGRIATAENSSAGNALATATADNTTGTGGGSVAVSGTSASASSLPSFTTARLCQVL